MEPEELKEACRHAHRAQLLGTVAAELQIAALVRGNCLERAGLIAHVEECAGGDREFRNVGRGFLEHPDQSIRLGIRQRLQQDAVHHAEDRRVRTDPQSQRQRGDDGEAP